MGPRGSQVKPMVKPRRGVGGGLKGTKWVACGSLWRSETTTKVVVMVVRTAAAAWVCPAGVFDAQWGPQEKS